MMVVWPITVGAALIGAALGSYATTAAIRYTRDEPSSKGRSHCDQCQTSLTYWETVPILSFAAGRGVCRSCGGKIDITHLVGEVCGATALGIGALVPSLVGSVLAGLLGLILLSTSVIDARTFRLPNFLTLAAAAVVVPLVYLRSGLNGLWIGLIAGLLTFFVLSGVAKLALQTKGEIGLGFGDVKLMAVLAVWLGAATPYAVAAASIAGLVGVTITRSRGERIPFGPYIAASAWAVGIGSELGLWPTTI